MKLMIAGATTTVEALLTNPAVLPYLGAMVTTNTGNRLGRVCGWNVPWCIDNSCFDLSKFDPARYMALMYRASQAPTNPVFATVPDVVADHAATLALFEEWFPKLDPLEVPLAFVAQDGLGYYGIQDDIPWADIHAVFIGGTDEFKDDMTLDIAAACKDRGKWCHMGRVNGRMRMRLALHSGVDSVDGSSLSKFPATYIAKFAAMAAELEAEGEWLDRFAEWQELVMDERIA